MSPCPRTMPSWAFERIVAITWKMEKTVEGIWAEEWGNVIDIFQGSFWYHVEDRWWVRWEGEKQNMQTSWCICARMAWDTGQGAPTPELKQQSWLEIVSYWTHLAGNANRSICCLGHERHLSSSIFVAIKDNLRWPSEAQEFTATGIDSCSHYVSQLGIRSAEAGVLESPRQFSCILESKL